MLFFEGKESQNINKFQLEARDIPESFRHISVTSLILKFIDYKLHLIYNILKNHN